MISILAAGSSNRRRRSRGRADQAEEEPNLLLHRHYQSSSARVNSACQGRISTFAVESRSQIATSAAAPHQHVDGHAAAMVARARLDEKFRKTPFLRHGNRHSSAVPNVSPSTSQRAISTAARGAGHTTNNILSERIRSLFTCNSCEPVCDNPVRNEPSAQPVGTLRASRRASGDIVNNSGKEQLLDVDMEECPICFESFSSRTTVICLPCQHKFHKKCLNTWLRKQMRCPNCRSYIQKVSIVKYDPSSIKGLERKKNVAQCRDSNIPPTAFEDGIRTLQNE